MDTFCKLYVSLLTSKASLFLILSTILKLKCRPTEINNSALILLCLIGSLILLLPMFGVLNTWDECFPQPFYRQQT